MSEITHPPSLLFPRCIKHSHFPRDFRLSFELPYNCLVFRLSPQFTARTRIHLQLDSMISQHHDIQRTGTVAMQAAAPAGHASRVSIVLTPGVQKIRGGEGADLKDAYPFSAGWSCNTSPSSF